MKKTSLVCQHLENVSREVMEEYQDIVRQYIRRRSGTCALFRRESALALGFRHLEQQPGLAHGSGRARRPFCRYRQAPHQPGIFAEPSMGVAV
jgi:hypothetical protein